MTEEGPKLNDLWISVYDGEKWWFTPSDKYYEHLKTMKALLSDHAGSVYCYECYIDHFNRYNRSNFRIARVLSDGCQTCHKKPKIDIKTFAKLMQL